MITVAIGWDLYTRLHSALILGGVGLAQMLPLVLLFLPAGYIIDRFNRKSVVLVANLVMVLAVLGLALCSFLHWSYLATYACLLVMGATTSFSNPAATALASQTVPEEAFEKAMTYISSGGQLASVVGPALAGFLISFAGNGSVVYLVAFVCFCTFLLFITLIYVIPQKTTISKGRKLSSLFDGVRFLWQTPVLLAAITLDLFAVLFGGATTLLPIFAQSILHVGSVGLGWLEAASSVGAMCMALFLARRPPFSKAGPALLLAVLGFGLATIVFGLSHWFFLSFFMLFLLGALDNISVVIRSTLVVVRTPNAMRGRVNAVNGLLTGTSNQLGGFESGLVAQFFGPVFSVVVGGIGTLLVVLFVMALCPDIRRLGKLRETS
jgi:MFS family permease